MSATGLCFNRVAGRIRYESNYPCKVIRIIRNFKSSLLIFSSESELEDLDTVFGHRLENTGFLFTWLLKIWLQAELGTKVIDHTMHLNIICKIALNLLLLLQLLYYYNYYYYSYCYYYYHYYFI